LAFDLFGFTIKNKKETQEQQQRLTAVVPPSDTEGGIVVDSPSGAYGYSVDFNSTDEKVLINKYREIALQAEIEAAIDEIVNEAIYTGGDSIVNIKVDKIPFSVDIKKMVTEEFETILDLLDFNENGYEWFKKWYVDGRIYFNILIDSKKTNEGIIGLRYIDPRKLKRVREVRSERNRGTLRIPTSYNEYYVYTDASASVKVPADTIAASTSGLVDDSSENNSIVLSYLHKAIRPFNQLKMLEDSAVIYRLARAAERRVFKIDVGNMPKIKAEQHINDLMNKFRSKVMYDSTSGALKDDARVLSVMEDFWIPVREGKGTEITTLAGASNLGEISDIKYFKDNLYNSLHIPTTRTTEGSTFNTGRATEIDRDEVKFSYFIQRLRTKFSSLFSDLLRKQLILKNIITQEDWDLNFKNNITFDFQKDSHFAEYNDAEILSRRIELAQQADSLGYFSRKYIAKKILQLTDTELDEIEKDNEVVVENKNKPEDDLGGGESFDDYVAPEPSMPEPEIEVEPEPEVKKDEQK